GAGTALPGERETSIQKGVRQAAPTAEMTGQEAAKEARPCRPDRARRRPARNATSAAPSATSRAACTNGAAAPATRCSSTSKGPIASLRPAARRAIITGGTPSAVEGPLAMATPDDSVDDIFLPGGRLRLELLSEPALEALREALRLARETR